MAEKNPPVSLIEREGMELSQEEQDAVQIEATLEGMTLDEVVPPKSEVDIEIIEEEDGGVTLDFDPGAEARESGGFYDNLAESMESVSLVPLPVI